MNTAPPTVGASAEVVRHHLDVHPCTDFHVIETWCPCRDANALLCSECGEALFLAIRPGTWCEHAEQFYQENCVAGVQR